MAPCRIDLSNQHASLESTPKFQNSAFEDIALWQSMFFDLENTWHYKCFKTM